MNLTTYRYLRFGMYALTLVLVVVGYFAIHSELTANRLIHEGYHASVGGAYLMGVIVTSYNAMPLELNPDANLSTWLISQYTLCMSGFPPYHNCPYVKVISYGTNPGNITFWD